MFTSGRNRRLLPLLVASTLAFLALDAAGFGPITSVRRTVLSIGQPVGAVLAAAIAPVVSTWNGAVHHDQLAEENGRLRHRIAELEGSLAGQSDLEDELRSLLDATEIEFLGDVDRVTARVVADRRTEIERIVEIDKGSDHGIEVGMPVVTGHGLAGTVQLVTGSRSVIRLITDADVAVGVRSPNGLALTDGRGAGGLGLRATPELAEAIRLGAVADGERFVTSGVDRSLYPPGIPVGTLRVHTEGDQLEPTDPGRDGGNSDGTNEGDETDGGPGPDPSHGDGLPSPAGPSLAADDLTYRTAGTVDVSLRPLADLERLGYLTVLLVEPPA